MTLLERRAAFGVAQAGSRLEFTVCPVCSPREAGREGRENVVDSNLYSSVRSTQWPVVPFFGYLGVPRD